jgi:predicted nucleotidyltransferase
MLDKKAALNTVKQYTLAVKKELHPAAVVMFGSYISGTPHEDSDIDVAVVFDGFDGDWRKTATNLYKLRRDISCDIEPHLLDIKNDPSGFAHYVINTGKVIYKQK